MCARPALVSAAFPCALFLSVLLFSAGPEPRTRAQDLPHGGPPATLGRGGTACPLPEDRAIPVDALDHDAPGATHVPFVSAASQLPTGKHGRRGIRFQEVFSSGLFPGPVTLTGLRFRLDAATPRSSFAGDLSYAVRVTTATFRGPLEAVSPVFRRNLSRHATRVFDGVVTVAGTAPTPGPSAAPSNTRSASLTPAPAPTPTFAPPPETGDEILILFERPVAYDPGEGHLVVDIRVRGLFGSDLPFALDAAESPDVVSVFSLEGRRAKAGQVVAGGPIVIFQAVPGDFSTDARAVAERCLGSLEMPAGARSDLLTELAAADAAAGAFDNAAVEEHVDAYRGRVGTLLDQGQITPEVAVIAHRLGAQEAFAFLSAPVLLGTAGDLGLRSNLGLALFSLDKVVGPFFSPDDPAQETLREVVVLTNTAFQDGGITEQERQIVDEIKRKLDELIHKAKSENAPDVVVKLLEDIKKTLEDFGLLKTLGQALINIAKDGKLDQADLEDVKKVKEGLAELVKKLGPDSLLGKGLAGLRRILCEIAAHLESGDLTSISTTIEEGKLIISFKVRRQIKILLFEEEVDTQSFYGKTTLRLYLLIKKDATIKFYTDAKKRVIAFEPPDAIDLDLDSSGIFVVDYLSGKFGFDLDRFCLESITVEDGKLTIRGKSRGKEVVIVIDGGATITVDGTQTFPKP